MIDRRSRIHALVRAVAPRRPAAGLDNALLTTEPFVSGTVAWWVKIVRCMAGFGLRSGAVGGAKACECDASGGNNRMSGWRG